MTKNIRTKDVYEAIIQKQRIINAKKQCETKESKKFFQESDVRSRQEKRWTSEASFNNSIMAYLLPDKEAILIKKENRKNKLRALLQIEADLYQYAISQSPEIRSDALNYLKHQTDDLLYKSECSAPEISTKPQSVYTSNKIADEKINSVNGSNEIVKDEEIVDSKTVVYDSCNSDERQREITSRQKLDESKQIVKMMEELNEIERKMLDSQQCLQQLATERLDVVEARHQRRFEKILLRQQTAALKRRSRQVQTEVAADLAWLNRLLALEGAGKEEKEAIGSLSGMLEEDLRREARREEDMDDMLASEAAELARRREQEWKCEEDARESLLDKVLSMCQDRVNSRLRALEPKKAMITKHNQALLDEINSYKSPRQPLRQAEKNADNSELQIKTEHSERRRRQAEAAFHEALREEAAKLNISVDEFARMTQ